MFFLFLIGLEISMFSPNISAPRQKFKNRLGAPESIAMMSFSPKNQPIWLRHLGSRVVLAILMDVQFLSTMVLKISALK